MVEDKYEKNVLCYTNTQKRYEKLQEARQVPSCQVIKATLSSKASVSQSQFFCDGFIGFSNCFPSFPPLLKPNI